MATTDTIHDLIAHATALELATALQELLRTSPRTVADSQFLMHLTVWKTQAELTNVDLSRGER